MKSVRGLLVSLAAAVALLGWVLPRLTGTTWSGVGAVLRTVPSTAVAGCLVLAMVFLVSYAFTLRASLPGLTVHKALLVNTAGSAAAKLLPGGGAAATFLLCRSWGFSANAVTTSYWPGACVVWTRRHQPTRPGRTSPSGGRLPGSFAQV